MKKTYSIPVVWSMYGHVEVEAESVDEAIDLAQDEKLPLDGDYLEGSFVVDEDAMEQTRRDEKRGLYGGVQDDAN